MDDDDEGGDSEDDRDGPKVELLHMDFIQKFIHYAKNRVDPQLTDVAREHIANAYNEIRQRQQNSAMPVTARTLETIIRLSTGHAKARLSNKVEEEDVNEALDILRFALYSVQPMPRGGKPKPDKKKTSRRRGSKKGSDTDEDEEEDEDESSSSSSSSDGEEEHKGDSSSEDAMDDSDGDSDSDGDGGARERKSEPRASPGPAIAYRKPPVSDASLHQRIRTSPRKSTRDDSKASRGSQVASPGSPASSRGRRAREHQRSSGEDNDDDEEEEDDEEGKAADDEEGAPASKRRRTASPRAEFSNAQLTAFSKFLAKLFRRERGADVLAASTVRNALRQDPPAQLRDVSDEIVDAMLMVRVLLLYMLLFDAVLFPFARCFTNCRWSFPCAETGRDEQDHVPG